MRALLCTHRSVTVVVLWAAIASCAPDEAPARQQDFGAVGTQPGSSAQPFIVIDLARLAGASSATVDSILGDPVTVTPVTSEPAKMPGEYRDYPVAGSTNPMTVRFRRDRAVFFTIYLPFAADVRGPAPPSDGLSQPLCFLRGAGGTRDV